MICHGQVGEPLGLVGMMFTLCLLRQCQGTFDRMSSVLKLSEPLLDRTDVSQGGGHLWVFRPSCGFTNPKSVSMKFQRFGQPILFRIESR